MSTDAAILKDVEGTDTATKSTTDIVLDAPLLIDTDVKTDRSTIMDQITERRNQQIAAEMDEPEPEPEPEPVPVVKIKVDGVESTVTEKEIREYQKQKAADIRLEELNKKVAELVARETALVSKEAKLAVPAPVVVDDAVDFKGLSKQLIANVFAENEEGVTQILEKVRGKSQVPVTVQPVLTEEDISAAVSRTLKEKERKDAVTRFAREYSTLDQNIGLRTAVDQQTIVEHQSDPDADIWTIIDRAAKHVKKETAVALGVKIEEPVADTLAVISDKERRVAAKRGAGPAVKATATIKAPLAKEELTKLTPFQELQKARGQG